jgi:hypothetical protein
VVDREDPEHDTQPRFVYAKFFQRGRSLIQYDKLASTQREHRADRTTVRHRPDLDAIVWLFPDDPALPQLSVVTDTNRVCAYFPNAAVSGDLQGFSQAPRLTAEVVNYRPELRCTIRYRADEACSDSRRPMVLFGKTFKDDQGSEIYRNMRHFWNAFIENPDGLSVPEPLGYDQRVNTLWVRGIPGTSFSTEFGPAQFKTCLDLSAKGLVRLHESQYHVATAISTEDHLKEALKKTNKLSRIFPALRLYFDRLAYYLECKASYDPGKCLALIHGDFHIRQLLLSQGNVFFCDFDELTHGDPIQDVANVLVDLHFYGMKDETVRDYSTAFLQSYRSQSRDGVDQDRLRWHMSIQFLNKAYRCFVQQWPRLDEELSRILRLMEHTSGVPPAYSFTQNV